MYVFIALGILFLSNLAVTAIRAGKTKATTGVSPFFNSFVLILLSSVLRTRCLRYLRSLCPGSEGQLVFSLHRLSGMF